MYTQHKMVIEADNGAEVLFVCPHDSCGRRLVLKRSGGLVVLDRGDFFALHFGGQGLEVSGDIAG
ncbi:hypothetical protein OHA18_25090 [Kribbella sp. NBC_00709]|uniref:hypothetical protein n=1 Tax=Kribbella sp. NBC_00709 TaxID=2975972 RepID=UPI002E29318C|nr:hypothetical protein [Kribbella sp. NBC_00709]